MTREEFTEKMRNIAESGKGKDAALPHIEGDALDDTTVHGVVTHFLNRVGRQDDEPIPVM
ncbi:hypothetical protein [Enterobacter ludwigii]